MLTKNTSMSSIPYNLSSSDSKRFMSLRAVDQCGQNGPTANATIQGIIWSRERYTYIVNTETIFCKLYKSPTIDPCCCCCCFMLHNNNTICISFVFVIFMSFITLFHISWVVYVCNVLLLVSKTL